MNNLRWTITSTLSVAAICVLTVAIAGRSASTTDPAGGDHVAAGNRAQFDPGGPDGFELSGVITCFNNGEWREVVANEPPSSVVGTDFGEVPLGGEIRRQFQVTNDDDTELEISFHIIGNTPLYRVEPQTLELGWQPSSEPFTVVFTPRRLGEWSAVLEVFTRRFNRYGHVIDDETRNYNIKGKCSTPLQVLGGGQQIRHGDNTPSIEDGTDFGEVALGNQVDRTFTLRNPSTEALDLLSVSLEGDADFTRKLYAGEPEVEIQLPIAGRVRLQAGKAARLVVSLRSVEEGRRRCTVNIGSTIGTAPASPYEFAVEGTGTYSPPMILSEPWAYPNPVVFPARVKVGVLAEDDGFPRALTYTWSKVSGPGGHDSVVFAPHETNPAYRYATFSSLQGALPGVYILKVIVSDGQESVEGNVRVVVNANGDFNSDFKSDVLWQSDGGQGTQVGSFSIWHLNNDLQRVGSTTITGLNHQPAVPPTGYAFVGCGDFDGDAQSDLVFQKSSVQNQRGELAIWKMNGAIREGNLTTPGGLQPEIGYTLRGCADFDGDSDTDLLFQHDHDRTLEVWKMNRTVREGAPVRLPTPDEWYTLRSCADFTGDGKTDILFQDNRSRKLYVWRMNGTERVGDSIAIYNPRTQRVPAVDSDYTLKGCADLSGDGKMDILFQHNVSRELVCWKMNGTSFGESVTIETIPQAGWSLRWPR